MPRYFLELGYKGSRYAGFQKQQNANTIQAEVEKAIAIYFRKSVELTGSSRTDAGVHAVQNYFHFDIEGNYTETEMNLALYRLNAILPYDIVLKSIKMVSEHAHCRFDAKYRLYHYAIYRSKNPFLVDRAYYYPYKLDLDKLSSAALIVRNNSDFQSFSKKHVQVQNYICNILSSRWEVKENELTFEIKGNRFLRGMVRGLVGTMLKVGTGKINQEEFKQIIELHDISKVDFSVPAHGLTLMNVGY